MENLTQKTVPTFESVWASLQETGKLLQETRENIEKSRADYERRSAEFDRRSAEFDRRMEKSNADFEKSRTEFDQKMEKSRIDSERRMKKLEETMGAWSNNQGAFAEEYFFNSFEDGKQTFFGEKFDRIEKNLKPLDYVIKDEYDIVLVNGKSVGIVEVKYKAHENDIPKVLKKAVTFKANHPNYAHHQIYLGLASMAFYPTVEQECIHQGIAVIKQVGDMVVINDTHLKVF